MFAFQLQRNGHVRSFLNSRSCLPWIKTVIISCSNQFYMQLLEKLKNWAAHSHFKDYWNRFSRPRHTLTEFQTSGKQSKEAYVHLRLLKGQPTFNSQSMPKAQLKLIHDKYAQYQFKYCYKISRHKSR